MNTLLLPFLLYFAQQPLPPVLVTDQAAHRIVMADANTGTVYWEWNAGDVAEDHKKWFSNPSDVKMVLNNRYVLTCASGGGVALIVKSVSPGPGMPALVTVPKEQWWTDEIHDTRGRSILKKEGWKIYKARWATSVSTSSHTLDNKDGSKKNALKKYTTH